LGITILLSLLEFQEVIGESLVSTNPAPNRYQYPVSYPLVATNNPLSKLQNLTRGP